MPLSYKEQTAPIIEPVSLSQAKAQLNVDTSFTLDDDLITGLIVAARQYVEALTNRAIYNRSVKLWLDYFPFPDWESSTVNPNDRHNFYGRYWHHYAIKLPKPGCVSVESIQFIDLSGTTQTLDPLTYFVDSKSEPARIVPIPGGYWPYTQNYLPNSVTVSYTAGTYGDGVVVDNCPMTIKQAILLLVSHWYANREATASNPPREIDFGIRALLSGEMFDSFGWS